MRLDVEALGDGATSMRVSHRGKGISEEVLKNALVPFFSTKQRGSGVGLPLCREMIEAHKGKMRLEPREGGGLVVSIWFRRTRHRDQPKAARLTLSRS